MELVDLPDNPLPPGAVVMMLAVGAVRIRVARWTPPDAIGTVVICPGRSEFIEKYAEVAHDLLARRLAVVVIDWRGQGGSSRLLADPRKGHVRSFDDYQADLRAVTAEVLPQCPRPYYALAHSMGGAIALDHAARDGAVFDRIVLSAPMLDIFGLWAPRLARRTAALVALAGGGSRFVPGGTGQAWMARPFVGNGLTSDRRRYAIFEALAAAAPELQIGAPTFGWLHAAFTLMARLGGAATLQRITTPVLAVACGGDRVVVSAVTERLVGQLKLGHTIVVPQALHEVLMEADGFRSQFWAAFDRFVPGSAAPPSRTAGTM